MKKLILFVLSLASLAFSQITTVPQVAAHIIYGTSTPATCKPTSGDIFFVVSGGGLGPYYCSATNTWSAMGSGAGGTITIAGTGNQITATGTACTAGGSGTCTISIPTSPTLPGTTTGSFSGSLNGVTISGSPSTGQVPTATSASTATWQTLGSTTTVSPTFTAIADGTCQSQAATWTGVSAGSALSIGPPAGFADGLQASVKVSAADTVTIKICNLSGASVTPGSQSFTLAYGIGALGSVPGTGTVTSVATTGPISGGTITGAGTISCPNCLTASSPGSGIARSSGSGQGLTTAELTGYAKTSGSNATVRTGDILGGGLPTGTVGNEVHKNLSIADGATSTILSQVNGAGYISELFIASNQYATEVIVTVDGEGTPSIDANICDLLLDNYCDSQPSTWTRWLAVSSNGSGQPGGTLRIPIPFATSVKVQAKNNVGNGSAAVITSHVIYHTGISDDFPLTQRLHLATASIGSITANVETDMVNVTPGKPWRMVGFGWIYDGFPGGVTPRSAPLEGAFKIYFDGSGTAGYATGGSEDIFGAPWYFRNATTFGSTTNLSPQSSDIAISVITNSTWGAQRFFIADPIAGSTGLRMTWTCGNTSAVSFTGSCTMKTGVYYYTEN